METYKKSSFYEKYHDTYYSDCILKRVFGQSLRIHPLKKISDMSYHEVYENNIHIMNDFMNLFWNEMSPKDEKKAFKMIKSFYIDPDDMAIKTIDNVKCTADGLISLNRLYAHEGLNDEMIRAYEIYRKTPIFFFPSEKGGINTTRAAVFNDRIDYTLYDIKRYLEFETESSICKMIKAYKLPGTEHWLREMGDLKSIADWLGIKGIFVNEDYEVYDIEKGDGSVIKGYNDVYPRTWSDDYYNNLKKKIELFYDLSK